MNRISKSLLTQYRREIATTSAVLASLLVIGRLAPLGSHDVVVAIREIPVGTQLVAADLGTVKSQTWPNEVRDPKKLIGKVVNHSIPNGLLITTADIVGATSANTGLAQIVIPLSQADSKLVGPGMHIDIYCPTGLVAADAVVISVIAEQRSGLIGANNSATAVIALSPGDVSAVANAKESSTLTIALRPET